MAKELPNKKTLHKQRMMTASYLLLVCATVASTYVLATSETLRMRTGLGTSSVSNANDRMPVYTQWDAEAVCEERVASDYPSHSVISVDSRSTRKLQSEAYHVVVQVDAPDHYSNNIDYVICKANLDSGHVSARKLGDDDRIEPFSMDFKNLF